MHGACVQSQPGPGTSSLPRVSRSIATNGLDTSKRTKRQRSGSNFKLSSTLPSPARGKANIGEKAQTIASRLDDEEPRPPSPKYEEYEQAPPSPWSQSIAPSPAVCADPKEVPFFTGAMVDEKAFSPGSAPTTYSDMRPPEAIGIDNSRTVLHVPLTHILLSRPTRPFKLDATAMEQRSRSRSKDDACVKRKEPPEPDRLTPDQLRKDNPAPTAILSILSPIVPYPSTLRHSLEHLAPHMATSFSLCRHHTNLESELAGIQRRRPATVGFGAVAPFARHIDSVQFLASGDNAQQQSFGGSITSSSDDSGVSRSATASPLGSPGWEQGSLNFLVDKRQPAASPVALSQRAAENYFSSKQRSTPARQETRSPGTQRSRAGSNNALPGEKRHSLLPASRFVPDAVSPEPLACKTRLDLDEVTAQARKDRTVKNTQEASTVTFIYKPVKPSRFAVIFDPDKVRDLSTDRNRSTAQHMMESQKASYQVIERRIGNKGYTVLLVEDNLVNQKVLMKYLKKIGVDVEVAVDGVECTEQVLSKPPKHYSLILCDLHMPRKDGYQACRELRQWERAGNFPKMPIIALSANVMPGVQDKCIAAGFSDYVTKPVDFIDLSRAIAKFL